MSEDLSKHWSRDAVVYQIYPLSFKDSNGDGKGDLSGIIEKLDYLNGQPDSLGVNAIWISPFYPSPMADFGYDISNFTDIDPVFGDMTEFERLVSELHKRNIKLIIDFVGNHTSCEHPWFLESKSSADTASNPKRDWYVWKDGLPGGAPPNNWLSVFGGSAWELDKKTNQYYLHSFFKEQPDLNWRNPEVRAAMMKVIDFWVEKGVDGFRMDAVEHFVEDQNLKNDSKNPEYKVGVDDPYKTLVHDHSLGDISKMNILGDFINEALKKYPEIFIVGEAYVGTSDLKKFYELCPGGRFAPFNFNLIGLAWEAAEFKKFIDGYQAMISEKGISGNYLPNYVLGNHDISRLVTRIGEAKARIKTLIQLTLPGVPFIYYGEELGMTNGVIPHEAIKDFLGKIFKGFHPGRDLERTPMQWDNSPHAGFSAGKPWLPIGDNFKTVNVHHEKADPGSMFSLYKSLLNLRKNSSTLRRGAYVPLQAKSPDVFSFERTLGDDRIVVYINFGENVFREDLPAHSGEASMIFSTSAENGSQDLSGNLELLPLEGYVIRL